ncbi:MAG: hypothetical protein IH849_10525 [Acidobacteria bacterium]|nr:hypothetical protein [Acidobacteriota bacterium]
MSLIRNTLQRTIALAVIVVLASLAIAAPAEAGCAREWEACGDCATKALYAAIFDLDLKALNDAYVDGIDCHIDFIHCLMFGHHHKSKCSV